VTGPKRQEHRYGRLTIVLFATASALLLMMITTSQASAQDRPWGNEKGQVDKPKTSKKSAKKAAPKGKLPKSKAKPKGKLPKSKAKPKTKLPKSKAKPKTKLPKSKAKPKTKTGPQPVPEEPEPTVGTQRFASPPPDEGNEQQAPVAGVTVRESVATSATPSQPSTEAQQRAITTNVPKQFVKALSPHGTWQRDKTYGVVWTPAVTRDFAPYLTNGQWAVNDSGAWVWMSRYAWGKTAFHYGRWVWLSSKSSWAWVPAEKYAPAWVVWRTGKRGHYIGWAPTPPQPTPSQQVKVQRLSFWFVPTRNLFDPKVEKHLITDPKVGRSILAHSRIHPGHYRKGHKGFAPASPSFDDAHIPQPTRPPVERHRRKVARDRAQARKRRQRRRRARRFATPPPRHRLRYRCRALNTRPRAWRCGMQ